MMKNKNLIQFIFTLFILSAINVYAQSEVFQYQKESFSRNYEADYSKGKTNVGIPLFSIPTSKANLKVNVALGYNTDNVSIHNMISDVGLGWNIAAGGVITKYLNFGLNDNDQNIYQYNFPGQSGRFYIKHDNSIGDIKAVEDYPSKNKIVIEKQSNSVFSSFKIIDEKGFKYIFDKKNISYRYEFSNPQSSPIGHGAGLYTPSKKELYTSAFFLTKILDEKDNLIVDYEYDVSTKTITTDGKQIVKNKLNKINITNVGSVTFNYWKQPLQESSNEENYTLLNIILKNKSNQVINQYGFEYTSSIPTGRRFLNKIIQKDKNNAELNSHYFSYHMPELSSNNNYYDKYGYANTFDPCYIKYDNFYSFKSINPAAYETDFLKSIKFPTGGRIEYEYEPNTIEITPYSADANTPQDRFSDFEVVKLNEINFDTKITKLYPFTVNNPGNYSKFFIKILHDFPDQSSYPHPSYEFNWKIQKSSVVSDTISRSDYINPVTLTKCDFVKGINIGIGTNFILNVGVNVYGKAEIFGVKKISRNFRYAKGGRIKKIKTYENNSTSPVKVLDFNYTLFSDPSKTSGLSYLDVPEYDVAYTGHVTFEGDDFRNDQEMILYKNLKVTDSIKNISTRYTFLMPEDIDALYGTNVNSEVFSFDYNSVIKKMGLTRKIEQFDANNQLVEKNETQNNAEYITNNNIVDAWNQPLKLLWIKSVNNDNQVTVNGSNILHSSQQKFFEPQNNLLTKEISTDFSGALTLSNIYYPKDVNNQKLINANIIGFPLKSETLQDGSLISKIETQFDDPATVYPTSQITYNMQTQAGQTIGTIESYDEMGNVREVKSKNGTSIVTIWGYYKTQPIAVIAGVTYAQIQNLSVLTAAVNASNLDNDNPANEPALIQALDNLRKSPTLLNTQIITYTYDPLIGITSTTSPTGIREINVYDNANRLLKVTDMNGKTLKEFKYNYKNQ